MTIFSQHPERLTQGASSRQRIDRARLMQVRMLRPEVLRATAEVAGAEAREDFWKFRQHIRPDMHTCWWQRNVAGHLNLFWRDFKAGRKPKIILAAPPQHGKSIQVEDFVAWASGKDPELKTMFTSYSEDLGIKINLGLQRTFDSERYQIAFSNTQLATETNFAAGRYLRNSSILEFVAHRGSFRNTTVLGQINGQGLDLGIVDDPMKGRKEAQSKTVRDSTWSWLTDDFFNRFSENAAMIMIMTRWHVDDPVGRWLERFPDTKVLVYRAVGLESGDWTVEEGYRRPGEPLFPEHKSRAFLAERKKLLSNASWESLYQQHPIIVGGGMFPIEEFQLVTEVNRKSIRRSMRYWDKAGTEDGGAYTAGVLMHELDDGTFLIEDVRHGQWGALERERRIRQTAEIDRPWSKRYEVVVEQEPGSGGKESAENTIRNLRGFRVRADKVTGDKVIRAEPYSSQVEAGNVKIKVADWNREFLDEHEEFPSGRRKDIVDASSGAFNGLTDLANRGRPYDSTLAWVQ